MQSKKTYSDREKSATLITLVANNGDIKKTSEQTGVPARNLYRWKDGLNINSDVRRMVAENRLDLANELEAIAFQCVGILPDKLQDASVKEIVGAMSQSIEKMLLLRGAPDVPQIPQTQDDKERLVSELIERARLRMENQELKSVNEENAESSYLMLQRQTMNQQSSR
jgi:hypothetical protein